MAKYNRSWLRNLIFILKALLIIFLLSALCIFIGTFVSISDVLPTPEQAKTLLATAGTKIYSSDGKVLLAHLSEQRREYVELKDIPKYLQLATIAIEDKRFYQHPGVDFWAILRALWVDIRNLKILQGGSTITQQLARNLYLTQRRTLSRKLQESLLALQIDRNYTKEEILELYLNRVFYGNGAYGCQLAAKLYFNKPVNKLTLAECALLAGIPGRPTYFSPFNNTEACRRRQKKVLSRMLSLGFITDEEYKQALSEKLKIAKPPAYKKIHFKAPYFTSYVIQRLVNRYGADLLYKSNLEVYTTLDWRLQQIAEQTLQQTLNQAQRVNATEAALVAIEPQTGYVKALVGGRDFNKSQFNRAIQARRQPGSAFKPFIYAAALEAGLTPNFTIPDTPVTYTLYKEKRWQPHNYTGKYSYRRLSLRYALKWSVNVVTVKLLDKIGIRRVVELAHRLGIKQPLSENLSLALGTSSVTPLEMATAFAAFANEGVACEPIFIKQIRYADGRILEQNKPKTRAVLDKNVAITITDLLKDVIKSGTGRRADLPGIDLAGKTGTTSEFRDAWFVGYSKDLSVTVWLGNDNFSPTRRLYGGSLPASAWAQFMKEAYKYRHPEPFKRPIVKTISTKPSAFIAEPTALSSPTQPLSAELSISATTIETADYIHVNICKTSGLLANEYCPDTEIKKFEIKEVPTATCTIHSPPP